MGAERLLLDLDAEVPLSAVVMWEITVKQALTEGATLISRDAALHAYGVATAW